MITDMRACGAKPLLFLGAVLLSFRACSSRIESSPKAAPPSPSSPLSVNVFDDYLKTEYAPADGFDFPVGGADGAGAYTHTKAGRGASGWRLAARFAEDSGTGINPGEELILDAGGDQERAGEVYAVVNGRVDLTQDGGEQWGKIVVIEHTFYENHEKRQIRSLYAHLSRVTVRAGEEVRRRQHIGAAGESPDTRTGTRLHWELRWDNALPPAYLPSSNGKDVAWIKEHYAAPTDFVTSHKTLFVPRCEQQLVLVDQDSYKMRLYREGRQQGAYDVSLGQRQGQKLREGDDRTPKGMYFVVQKHEGEFPGPYGGYYGGHWIKINYPNRYDAERGLAEGIIKPEQASKIAASWERREPTLEDTALGGGIGFHGWFREWSNNGPRHLSRGCVVLHLSDINNFYDQVPVGSMVVIF